MGIRLHCVTEHIPRDYVEVIASGNEDHYNHEVAPRDLPLRPGILILREPQPIDTDTPSGTRLPAVSGRGLCDDVWKSDHGGNSRH